jgi:hypothetical protein
MEKKYEQLLQNTNLKNVLQYLYGKLKELRGKQIETTTDDGTICAYVVQNVFPSNSNKIEVNYTTAITPKGNVEKSFLWRCRDTRQIWGCQKG